VKARRGIWLGVGVVALLAVTWLGYRVHRVTDYEVHSPYLVALPSPDANHVAYLLRHGILMGCELTLLVSPTGSEDDARWVGTVESDDSLTFAELVWSKDSSVVAARSLVTGYNRLPEGQSGGPLFTHAYDFAARESLVPANDSGDATPEAWGERDARIRDLLAARGGEVGTVSGSEVEAGFRKLTWAEWRLWRERIRPVSAGR